MIAPTTGRDGSKPMLDVALALTSTLHVALDRSIWSSWDGDRTRRGLDTENDCIAGLLAKDLKEADLHEIGIPFHELGCIREITECGRLSPIFLERSQAHHASSNDLCEDLLQFAGKHDVADFDTEELQAERRNLRGDDFLKLRPDLLPPR